jgi:hypothetical protein
MHASSPQVNIREGGRGPESAYFPNVGNLYHEPTARYQVGQTMCWDCMDVRSLGLHQKKSMLVELQILEWISEVIARILVYWPTNCLQSLRFVRMFTSHRWCSVTEKTDMHTHFSLLVYIDVVGGLILKKGVAWCRIFFLIIWPTLVQWFDQYC